MDTYFHIFIDTVFGFFALFAITKILGKTQMSQLTAFDFISAIILGELVGNALFDEKAGVTEIAFVVTLWGVLMFSINMITQKFQRTRYFLEGKPALLIHQGNLIREVMKKNKIDINEVQHLLREKDVFSLREVEYGILEANGKLSVLKKAPYQNPNKQDLNVMPNDVYLPLTLIADREVIMDNLNEAGLSREWLDNELRRQGYRSADEVFYAEYIQGQRLFINPFLQKAERKTTDW